MSKDGISARGPAVREGGWGLITHYSSLITHHSLLITHYSLLIVKAFRRDEQRCRRLASSPSCRPPARGPRPIELADRRASRRRRPSGLRPARQACLAALRLLRPRPRRRGLSIPISGLTLGSLLGLRRAWRPRARLPAPAVDGRSRRSPRLRR